MNRDTIYLGSVNDFFREYKYPNKLNVYVEVSTQEYADIYKLSNLFKKEQVDMYGLH